AYLRWGARAKAQDLAARYPDVLREGPKGGSSSDLRTGVTVSGEAPPAEALDLMAVTRASQAISGEIILDDLLRTLKRTLLELAGADRGALLLHGEAHRMPDGDGASHAERV